MGTVGVPTVGVPTVGVVVFPGTNCEHDVVEALSSLGGDARLLWHGDNRLGDVDAVVLPGGFAHGDYLRPGAIARFSPIMGVLSEFAAAGGPIVGICNGFQILTEAGLLPGALQKNKGLRFLCTTVAVRVETARPPLTGEAGVGTVLRLPVNHFEGNFTCSERTLKQLQSDDRVLLRYVDNPNGSVDNIAAVCSSGGNVVGLMPHPERAADPLLGSDDGRVLLSSLLSAAGDRLRSPATA